MTDKLLTDELVVVWKAVLLPGLTGPPQYSLWIRFTGITTGCLARGVLCTEVLMKGFPPGGET